MQDDFPRLIVVTFQHPNPYYDDSYAVNSVNVGPYGDALMQELIPAVEKQFRVITEPYARLLSGGSTGGWEALALQIFHPDFFGGTWCYCPDPVTFSAYEGVNIYKDENAFYKQHEWYRVPTPNMRDTDGEPRITVQQKNHFELVNGTQGAIGPPDRHLERGLRPARQGRLLRAAHQSAHGRDRPDGRAATGKSTTTCFYSHAEALAGARPEDRRQAAHLHRRHGHVSPGESGNADGGVDEDDDQSALSTASSCTAIASRTAGVVPSRRPND